MKTSALWALLAGLLGISTLAADKVRPTVLITAPAPNARFTPEAVHVSGRATDNVGVIGVDVFVDGEFGTTVDVASNHIWSAELVLEQAGPHEIAAESFDAAGNRSVRAKVKVTRVVLMPLTLDIDPGGRVVGATNGQSLEIAKRYTITALAEAGYVFTGWGGAITSSAPTISFTMAPGLELHARFRATTFTHGPTWTAKGICCELHARFRATTFTGLFFPHMYDFEDPPSTNFFGNIDEILPENSGYFQITRTANGRASGKLVIRGRTIPFGGVVIRADDTADFAIVRYGTRTLYISFDIVKEEGLETLRGTIDDGQFVADLAADSVARSKNPLVGKYNFELAPGSQQVVDPTVEPPGGSIGGIRITGAYGAITGSLADGTPFSVSSQISAPVLTGQNAGETYLPIYIPLRGGSGMLIGWMSLNTDQNLTPAILGPQIHWFKPPAPYDRYYRNGFSISRETAGYRYTIPALNQNALGWTNGTLYLDYGNLQVVGSPGVPEIQKRVTASRTKLTISDDPSAPLGVPSVQDLRIALSVNPAVGTATGTFKHPVSGANTRINATILQRPPTTDNPDQAPYVSGYFLGTDQGGDVVILRE